jgi:hypothetical protein
MYVKVCSKCLFYFCSLAMEIWHFDPYPVDKSVNILLLSCHFVI